MMDTCHVYNKASIQVSLRSRSLMFDLLVDSRLMSLSWLIGISSPRQEENTHLCTMKQHSVPRFLHRGQAHGGGSRRQHDLAVGVEQRQSHEGQVHPVKHTVLVVDGSVAKEKRVVTKNAGVEETQRLVDDGDEEVGDGRRGGEDEDDADEEDGARDRAHLAVVQREADGDVALQGHASQEERGGAGGEDCCHDLRETQ